MKIHMQRMLPKAIVSNKKIYIIVIQIVCLFSAVQGQAPINLVRYNDNFGYLKSKKIKSVFEQLKYIRLDKQSTISFGGEVREQLQKFTNYNFSDLPPGASNANPFQLNHRAMVHSNVEIGKKVRFFGQIGNTLRGLNPNPAVPEIDQNSLNIIQMFGELKLKTWNFRLGRQEVFYGSHRLITVREGPNTRKSFDGVIIRKNYKSGWVDFIGLTPVISKKGIFDDESFKETLVGIYGLKTLMNGKIGVEYYVTNFTSKLRKYNFQSGSEVRQTYGFRAFSNFNRINFEIENAYQSGTFNGLTIDAYSLLGDINYSFSQKRKGVFGLTVSCVSGDRKKDDGKLNTYDLLFAKPAYGLAVPMGATNIVSYNPYFKINATSKFHILAEMFFLKRFSDQDGTYSPGMVQTRPTPINLFSSIERKLGTFYVLETNYQLNNNFSFALDGSYFNAGDYPKTTGGGKNISYLSIKTTFKF